MSVSSFIQHVCKIGQGEKCCRYLMMGTHFECAKLTPLKHLLDIKAQRPNWTSKGDNCAGFSSDVDLQTIIIKPAENKNI